MRVRAIFRRWRARKAAGKRRIRPIEHNMRGERLTVADVMEEARDKEIENLDEIKFAVLEPGGQMTFIKK